METYKVTLTYVRMLDGADTETKERTFTTNVTIREEDPFTDVSDIAHERLCAKVPNCEVLSEDISNKS